LCCASDMNFISMGFHSIEFGESTKLSMAMICLSLVAWYVQGMSIFGYMVLFWCQESNSFAKVIIVNKNV
jgi:hypothetical protein